MNRMDRDELSPQERAELVEWIREQRRKGADALRAKAAFQKPITLTNAESTARARAKLEGRNKP